MNGTGPWTVVYDSWREDGRNGGRFVALSDPSRRSKSLGSAAWDLTVGHGLPGFSQHYGGGEEVTEYHRISSGDGLEPLVVVQEFHGVVPDAHLISEEFRLLMGLWEDPASGNYYSIGDDGSKELAVEYVGKQIRVRTPLLRRYQAARQLDLLLFTDSVVDFEGAAPAGLGAINEPDHVEGDAVIFVGTGDSGSSDEKTFSRLLVKRVLPPPPQEKSGIWPWEAEGESYPEFTIGEDADGQLIRFTCDPEQLANYFGKNPGSPHYLTPVFFKPEVLRRYYDDPLYEVRDGRLSCAYKWGIQVDNGNPEAVMVFLGDLGRDLPEAHRDYWRGYNTPPVAGMSESTFRRSFLAQFAESDNPEHIFKNAYLAVQRTWLEVWGWSLYRDATGSDADLIQRVRIPLNDTDTEFEAQVLTLAKLLVDLLNEGAIAASLEPVKDEKGISKLKRFLESVGYEHVERDIALLRRAQGLRSRIAAHTSGSRGQEYLATELGGLSRAELVQQLMHHSTQMFDDLARISPPQN